MLIVALVMDCHVDGQDLEMNEDPIWETPMQIHYPQEIRRLKYSTLPSYANTLKNYPFGRMLRALRNSPHI